jgi:hypothetical protein
MQNGNFTNKNGEEQGVQKKWDSPLGILAVNIVICNHQDSRTFYHFSNILTFTVKYVDFKRKTVDYRSRRM